MNIRIMVLMTVWASFAFNSATSQTIGSKITGQVFTLEKRPAEATTITLVTGDNSTIVKTTKADIQGNFTFEQIKSGKYQLWFTMVGFQKLRTDFIIIDSTSSTIIELEKIILVPDAASLTEVKVTSKKPFVEHKIDRTVVNVGALISNTGTNALEVLEKSPGVIVSQNGTISYMGKSGVLILIDDKPTYLSGDNLTSYLKSLPASLLDQIELMSNPPAKYEAGGTAGVINIKTKKLKAKGLNGTVVASFGKTRYWRTNESLNLNYYNEKVNLFANIGYTFQKSDRILKLQRSYFDAGNNLIATYNQQAYFRPATHSNNVKLGMDYFVSSKTTVGVLFTGSFSPGRYNNPVNTSLYNNSGLPDSTIVANNTAKSKFNNGGINLNFLRRFDSLGKTLTFDIDYIKYSAHSDQSFINSTFHPNSNLKNKETIISSLPADIHIYTAKTDYTQPLKEKGKLEFGLKTSFVNTDNAANYFNVVNNISTVDYNNTNRFLYKENINASYINFSKELKRVSFQAGLRMEHTDIKGLQSGNFTKPDSAFKQNYSNIFPTGYLSYKLDTAGSQLLNFSYGRRIDRPYYKDLNPFTYIVDKYTYFSGNPFLKPQLSSNYELSYSYKSFFSTTLFYNRYKNFQTETVYQAGGIFVSTPANIGQKITTGINANASLKPAKWWDCNIYSEVVNLKFNGQLNNGYLNSNSTYFYTEAGNQFDLSNGWAAELSGFYITGRTVSQFNLDPKGQLSAGIQKKILKNKASIKVGATDILRTNISSGNISNIAGATSTYHNDFDTRMLTVGFSYNFGKSGNNVKKRKTGSSQSEQNRVKN